METLKKILKILPWALLIIAITAIVAEVRFINLEDENYAEYNKSLTETVADLQAEATKLQAKAADLQKKAADLQKKAADLQGKADFYQEQIDAYANKPNEWKTEVDGLSKQIKQIYTADKEALNTLATDLFMKAADKIAKNDYSTFPEFPVYRYYTDQPLEITIDGSKYEMRNREFYWMEDEYSNLFTGDLLDKVFDKRFIIKEGYFYVKEIEAGAKEWGVVNAELTRISEKGDEIKYSVKYDCQEQGKITAKDLTCTMTIKYEDGRYRVSDTNLGNL